MSSLDLVLGIIILLGAFFGYREGFLMSLFSLLAIILGILGAFKLLGWTIILLGDQFDLDQKYLPYVAFAVVFLVIVIVVRLLGNMIKLSIDRTFLGRIDQLAGAVLGLFKTAFLVSVALWIANALRFELPSKWTEGSILLPYLEGFAPALTSWIAEIFPVFEDVF